MKVSRQDLIWNRACLEAGGKEPAEGDRALASLLVAHGLIMNGGVVYALDCLGASELTDAIEGFKYFGLSEASAAISQVPDDSEETEEQLNQMYWSEVPSDEMLVHAFQVKLLASPEAFAPTGPEADA